MKKQILSIAAIFTLFASAHEAKADINVTPATFQPGSGCVILDSNGAQVGTYSGPKITNSTGSTQLLKCPLSMTYNVAKSYVLEVSDPYAVSCTLWEHSYQSSGSSLTGHSYYNYTTCGGAGSTGCWQFNVTAAGEGEIECNIATGTTVFGTFST